MKDEHSVKYQCSQGSHLSNPVEWKNTTFRMHNY